jgi:1-acyl-sn-glycerol-3-phosphate acyltransferase
MRKGFPWSAPDWPNSLSRPSPERKVGVDYDTDWSRRYPARLARALILDNLTRPLTHIVASPEVRGDDVLELVDPPAIFVANHSSHLDTPLLLAVLPPRMRHRTVVAAAADHFFDRTWKAHLWALALCAIPIERHRVNRRSADLAAALLEEGWNLIIYPEGGRSHDGWFQVFRGGAAYLAVRTGRPVVPVHVEGTHRILPPDAKRLHRHPTTITFGAPVSALPGEDARALSTRIESAVAVLADEHSTDFWSALKNSAGGHTPSARGPEASPWRRAWALRNAQHDDKSTDDKRWAVSRGGAQGGTRLRRWRRAVGAVSAGRT